MNRLSLFARTGFLAASLGLLTSPVRADVLFHDGFVVGEGGYTTDSVNNRPGDALSGKSSAASTGFSGVWQGETATVRMSQTGLEMPRTSHHRHGGGAMWMNYGNVGYRAVSHQLAGMPDTGTVYFMTLMKCQDGAMNDFGEGDMALLGVKPGGEIVSTINKVDLQGASGLWFGFMKSGGTVYPAVKIGASVTPFSSQAAQMNATYICEGRIEYGAGADGTDRLSWNIRTTDEWDAAETKESWAGTRELALGQLTYLSASYLIQTGGRSIWFDEVRAATTYSECVGRPDLVVATGLPDGYRAASGTFTAIANAGETVTAPEFVNPDVSERTLRCRGYVVEKKVGEGWEPVSSAVTRVCAFTVPEAWSNTPDLLRLTWQWDESPQLVSCTGDPVLISDLFKAAGYVDGTKAIPDASKLHPYAKARNVHTDAGERLFDGLTWYLGDSEVRMLGYMAKAGGSDVTLDVPGDVLSGDELLLCEYRLSPLSYWGNLTNRMPTAWTLCVSNAATAAAGGWADADVRSGVDVSRVPAAENFPQSQEASARFDYRLDAPVPFTSLKFRPEDSLAYQDNLANGTKAIDWGLLEIALLVRRANPKGTLRVSAPGIGPDGFSAADRALLTAAATLTAPAEGVASDGGTVYQLTGWVLETFDEATGLWTVATTGTGTSFDWTPDADARARLTWLYDRDAQAKYKVTGVSERTSDTSLVGTWIKEDVSVAPAAEGGYYASGTTVTVTATPDTADFGKGVSDQRSYQSLFVRWIGDTDGLDVDLTSPSITFAVDRPRALLAVFDRNWLLCENGGDPIIHNANWRFQVSYDTSARTVTVKNWTRGSGRLNFDTPVYDQEGRPYSITIFGNEVAGYTGGSKKTEITELILPKTLVQLGGQCFRANVMTNLVMDCPDLVSVGAATLARNYDLAKVAINIPSVKSITANYPFFNWLCTDTDLSTWNISSLTNIPYQMLCQQFGIDRAQAHACGSGALALPRAQSIAGGAFEKFAQAAEFHLGTADAKLGSIADAAFRWCAATNFVIGCTRSITVHATAFHNHLSGGPEAFHFIAAAPAEKAVMENFLASNSSNRMAKVYVSRILNADWSLYVTRVADIADDAVKAQAVALGADGAFQTDDGEWKAFVFARKMPFDPNGTFIIVR